MNDEQSVYVIFRGDLPEMTRGKSEVQFGHAIAAIIAHHGVIGRYIEPWLTEGQRKVSLETGDMDGIVEVCERASKRGVYFETITDAGRTCFSEPTLTCVAIGPCSKTDGNYITRGTRPR